MKSNTTRVYVHYHTIMPPCCSLIAETSVPRLRVLAAVGPDSKFVKQTSTNLHMTVAVGDMVNIVTITRHSNLRPAIEMDSFARVRPAVEKQLNPKT